jgi:hypothetical protein
MGELRDGLGLALEAGATIWIATDLGRQHFQRHVSLEARVARLVDLAHSARPERADDLVRPQAGAWRQWHRIRSSRLDTPWRRYRAIFLFSASRRSINGVSVATVNETPAIGYGGPRSAERHASQGPPTPAQAQG